MKPSDTSQSGGNAPGQVTELLRRAQRGEEAATDELLPLVYDELRQLAAGMLAKERAGHTLQPTALVHEAYLRLVGPQGEGWEGRAHFFGAAARAIRRILVDHARSRGREKRGGGRQRVALEDQPTPESPVLDLLALDEALEELARIDPRMARLVELRFFAGLTVEETAATMGISAATAAREWGLARVWLHSRLEDGSDAKDGGDDA